MVSYFLGSPVLIALASLAAGAVAPLLAYLSGRFNQLPAVKEVKEQYPLINTFVRVVADSLPEASVIGLVADAAAAIWGEDEQVETEAIQPYVAAAVAYFKESKYNATDFEAIDSETVEKGKQLAEKFLRLKSAN